MTDAMNANTGDAAKGSGCGCSSKAAPATETAKPGCCGGSHDHAGHDHAHHDHAHGSATVRDPVCGMTVDPATAKHRFDHQGETHYFCSAGCRTKFAADPKAYLGGNKPKADSAGRRDLHLPDASADPPGRSRQLPDLRHGAGARGGQPRYAAQSRTRRHDAAVLDRPRAFAARRRAGNGRSPGRRSRLGRPDPVELDSAGVRHARGAVGGLAVLRARLAIAADAQSQHVHPDRDGHRRRLCLQRRRHRRARDLPGHLPRPWRRGGGLLRSRRGHYRARAAWPGARTARPRGDLRRDQGAARTGAEDRAPHRR